MKAIVLISGGLDSSLTIRAVQKQEIEVIALHFLVPFTKHDAETVCDSAAKRIAESLGCEFKLILLEDEYLDMVKNPSHGYGSNINPCIDCKILMLKRAREIMLKEKAAFIATGEVLGQRPMSQHRQALELIARESGLADLLVRPLSALLLPETVPQKEGWLRKEFLFGFSGRGRSRQIALAKQWEIKDYPWPGGGCLLTDPAFSRRLKDIMEYGQFTLENIALLKLGRYFRINPSFWLVVGRNEAENGKLLKLHRKGDIILEPLSVPGPTAIGRGIADKGVKNICAQLVAWYTTKDDIVKLKIKETANAYEEIVDVKGIAENKFKYSVL